MKFAVLLTVVIALSTIQTDAIRVQFPPGTSAATIKGTFGAGNKVRYIVHAAAGQQLKVGLAAPGADYRFFVYAPSGDEPLNGLGMAFEWSGVVPTTGDYVIQVFTDSPDRSAPFQIEISVTKATPAGTVAQPAESEASFSPDGYYIFSGQTPKGFANFKGFSFTTSEPKADGTTMPVAPNGEFEAGNKFKLTNIQLTKSSLSFETRPIRGATYKFEGKFLVSKGWCDDGHTTGPVLGGHLIKLLNGAKVAEAEVKFEWSCSDI